MTSTTTPATRADAPAVSTALRHWVLVLSPVVAGLLAIAGTLFDAAVGMDGRELFERYGANPDRVALKSLSLHWSYALLLVPALWVGTLVRGRGRNLANAAVALGFVGVSTLPGLLFVDFYDSAIAQAHGTEGAAAVNEVMTGMWGVPVFVLPGLLGTALGAVLAAVALWRAGLVRWWAPASVVGALAAFNAEWTGALASTLLLSVFALALHRATDRGLLVGWRHDVEEDHGPAA